MLDPIQYEFRFLQNTLVDPEPRPGAGAETSDIPAPAPAKSFGSMRLQNTDRYHLLPAVMKGPQLVRLLGQGLGVLVVDPGQ
jgi:hypothetical protein